MVETSTNDGGVTVQGERFGVEFSAAAVMGDASRVWIERHLHPEQWRGDEATIRCPLPGHDDNDPSATANAGKRAWYCHRCDEGGKLSDLAERMGVPAPAYPGANGLHPIRPVGRETVYLYQNAAGDAVFEVVRKAGDKKFLQRHRKAPDGPYSWKAPPAGKGLVYRLPKVLTAVQAGEPVLIVEGEKDVDRLEALGYTATCNAGGAGKWTRHHANHLPPGSKVYVLPDCDVPGIAHRDKVCRSLLAQSCEAHAVDPGAFGYQIETKHGKDVSNWLDADPSRGRAEVEALLNGAEKYAPAPKAKASTAAPAEPTEDDPRPGILCARGGRDEWTREAVKVLVGAGPEDDRRSLYGSVRIASTPGGATGDVVTLAAAPPPEPDARLRVPEGALLIRPVTMKGICRRLDRAARWFAPRRTRSGDDTFEPSNPTPDDAEHVLETYKDDLLDVDPRPRLRTLRGVVDAPSLRRDGTVIDRPGWDSATWLYADFDPKHWQGLPAKPTRDDARKALLRLYDLVEESSFAEPIHRAAWAALVLTLVGRPYAAGNVPLFAFTANAPGVGKGTLVDLAAIIATGRPSAKWAPVSGRKADAESEERKRLMAIALAGARCVCIDNIKAGDPLGTPALDAALTAGTDDNYGTVADRVLGETAITEAPWSCVLAATGNNLTVIGDMARRTLLCRLETNNPDPETRVYRHHPKVADYCIAHRGELLTVALTVLVAHRDAVRRGEAKPLPRIGSFGGWSDRIRSAVAWADPDGCDPWASNAEVKAGAQPEQAEALTFLDAWHGTFGTREVVVKEIGEACREGEPDYAAELAEAAGNLSLPPPRGKAGVNTQALGRWLAARKDRPGPCVLREGRRYSGKPARWYVEQTATVSPEPDEAGARLRPTPQEIRELMDTMPWRVTRPIRDAAGNVLLDVGEHKRTVVFAAVRKAGKDGDLGAWKWTGEPIRLRFPDAPEKPIPDGDLAAVLPQPDEPVLLTAPVYHPEREGFPVIDKGKTTLSELSTELVKINQSWARNGNRQRNFNLAIGHQFQWKAKPGAVAGEDGSKEGEARQWRTVEVTWLPWEPDETPDLFEGNGKAP